MPHDARSYRVEPLMRKHPRQGRGAIRLGANGGGFVHGHVLRRGRSVGSNPAETLPDSSLRAGVNTPE